jgi:hypothetical protein
VTTDGRLDQERRSLFRNACQEIIKNRDKKALNYAVNYAVAGMYMVEEHTIKVQCLYILNNITYWRGGKSKSVRADLKKLVKELK